MLALNYVKKNLRAGGFAQAVLAYLADCMNEADGKCFPSRETIAEVSDRFAAVAKHFEFKRLSNVRQSKNRDSRNQTRGCVVLFDRSDAHLGDRCMRHDASRAAEHHSVS